MDLLRSAAMGILVLISLAIPVSRAHAVVPSSVTLKWTAPGDDGKTGTATAYDIRFSRNPITAANFSAASKLTSLLIPGPAGTQQQFTIFGLTPGALYYFAVKSVDEAGNWSTISNVVSYPGSTVDAETPVLSEPHFSVPFPNPARNQAKFTVSLPKDQWVRIEAFDISGRGVRTLAMGEYSGGTFDITWDLRDTDGMPLRAGAYLVRGQLGENVFLRRVTIVH
jgi:hypothetical protein